MIEPHFNFTEHFWFMVTIILWGGWLPVFLVLACFVGIGLDGLSDYWLEQRKNHDQEGA